MDEKKKIYLVDSENVGDLWVTHIMALAREEDEIVVFYTQKSPHMGYDTIRKLLASDREVDFIKCSEGKNALDFQLVTELGFRLGKCEDVEYIMVTNDTGFDAVVQYWQNAGKSVRRYNAKYCQNQYNKMMVEAQLKKENVLATLDNEAGESLKTEKEEKSITVEEKRKEQVVEVVESKDQKVMPEEAPLQPKEQEKERIDIKSESKSKSGKKKKLPEKTEGDNLLLRELVNCLGANNSGEIHNALTMFLGNDGKQVYQKVKGNLKEYVDEKELGLEERFGNYCKLIFERGEEKEKYPKNFSEFVYGAKEKRQNLNSFRSALLKEYGKEKGMQYYTLVKPHVKILNKMQK